ncbi:MAG TPA: hypothetical protein DCZ62_00725 [Ruminococcus sp.]|nr:hypothetical protein [Ruminococcus sp.]
MKLYKSLIYREMKLSRAYYGFCILFFALLITTVLVGLILPNVDEGVAPGEARLGFTLVSLVIPVLGALFVTRDGGNYKKDVNSGWARAVAAYPVTSKQRALAELLMRLISSLVFMVLGSVVTIVINANFGVNILLPYVSAWMLSGAVGLLIDAGLGVIVMLTRDKKQLKKYIVIANVAMIALLGTVAKYIPSFDESIATKKLLERIVDTLYSGWFFLICAAILCAVSALFLFVYARSYERREA